MNTTGPTPAVNATAGVGQLTLSGGTYSTLNALSKGGIDQSGALTVTGTTTLTADTTEGHTINIDTQATKKFRTVLITKETSGKVGTAHVDPE